MLAYILALVVAIGSFMFYVAAFFVPELHRRQDFFWSGLGLFYAVVLWFCAGRLTGAVLLGQVVSVALLGGLGWHTLALRRDLTPETVQTPVTWADLRQWVHRLQAWAAQSSLLESIIKAFKSVGNTASQAVAQLRDRTTRPRDEAATDVPPLKRSPAYEFETATGTGQTVPSEFASVSQREQTRIAAQPEAPETANDGEPIAPVPDSAASTPAATTAAAETALDETAETAQSAASEAEQQPPTEEPVKPQPAPVSPATSAAAPPTAPPPPAQSAQPAPPPPPQPNPIAGTIGRLGAVFKRGQKPQPPRGVIEIPPRAPSIPRSPDRDAPQPSASKPATSDQKPVNRRPTPKSRGVIDIPPRPPSIPRSPTPSPDQGAAQNAASIGQRTSQTQSNWVDEETNWVDSGDPSAPPPIPEPPTAPPIARAPSESASSPAPETNWPAESSAPPTSADPAPDQPLAPTEDDTNWPEDDYTNWPD